MLGGYRGRAAPSHRGAPVCDGKIVMAHEGGYSPNVVPYCSLAVVEQLSGLSTSIVDPLLAVMAGYGHQSLQPHQAAAIDEAADGACDALAPASCSTAESHASKEKAAAS